MNDPRHMSVEQMIAAAMSAFRAQRRERTIFAGGRKIVARTAGERVLYLPNGQHVNVAVDDSGTATQVDDGDNLHAIVRPGPISIPIHTRRTDP